MTENRDKRYRELLTPANMVTTARIVLIPVFVFLLLAPWPDWAPDPLLAQLAKPWIAAAVFALLAMTDGLDGYLARSRNEVTNLGKFLDPLADKILVTAALLALIELDKLPAWIALIIIGRDFLVSGLRMVASAENQVIAASHVGKTKTVFQILAMILFIIKDASLIEGFGRWPALAADLLAWLIMLIALLLTLLSMIDYFIKSSSVLGLPLRGGKNGGGDASAHDVPVTPVEVRASDVSASEAPASDEPAIDVPESDVPATDEPAIDEPLSGKD